MPTVGVKEKLLAERLGRSYTEDEFQDLCFAFGIELDEVTSEAEELEKAGSTASGSDETIFKIDIPANRYDLLCLEGICRGLNVFLEKDTAPTYTTVAPTQSLSITANCAEVRPFCVAAVLRGVTFNKVNYESFIDLQDKLHQNICRRRTLVAIGTHDLSTIQGPFVYDCQKPEDIVFKPLRVPDEYDQDKAYSAKDLMEMYKKDLQLKQYLHIIEDKPVFPVIRDANGVVLSLPPIINGDHSKITLNTKDVFIECTATDMTKAKIVLNMMVTMFAEYSSTPFQVEQVNVTAADGTTTVYPDLSPRADTVLASDIYKKMGIQRDQADPAKLAELLSKMQLSAKLDEDGDTIHVEIPVTRPDIIHACDLWEDAAVAFGFNNIVWTTPKVVTAGRQLPVNKLTDQLRHSIATCGYSEALTFALCKAADNFTNLRREDDGTSCVIANPKTQEFQVTRNNLLSGLLKTLNGNASMPLPIQIFEVSDVVLKDSESETGARNVRHLCAAAMSKTAGFQDVQGLLDYIMKMVEVNTHITALKDKRESVTSSCRYHGIVRPSLLVCCCASEEARHSPQNRAEWLNFPFLPASIGLFQGSGPRRWQGIPTCPINRYGCYHVGCVLSLYDTLSKS
eukprot:m.173816 g.173816  ORF g.173816 m.173816 type:complete len:625 (+) comp14587_c0_seq9:403-2277(+)